MDGQVLSADEAKGLADLESREVMLSKIAGLLKGEMSRAASMFVSAQSKFLSLLEAYKEKVPDDSAEPEVAEPAAEEPEAAAEAAEAGRRDRGGRGEERREPRPRPRPTQRRATASRRRDEPKHPPPRRRRRRRSIDEPDEEGEE